MRSMPVRSRSTTAACPSAAASAMAPGTLVVVDRESGSYWSQLLARHLWPAGERSVADTVVVGDDVA